VPDWRRQIVLRPDRTAGLGGLAIPAARQVAILSALGFEPQAAAAGGAGTDGPITVQVPSWRPDIAGEADLVEEVLRVHGYDAIPATPMVRPATVTRPAIDRVQRAERRVRRTLAARGLDEAVTWSFLAAETAARFGHDDPGLVLVNPIASDLAVMRPSILPNLIEAARRNAARGLADVGLFEVGPVYRSAAADGQDRVAAALRAGPGGPRHWDCPAHPPDAWDAKADALAALDAAGAPVANLQVTTDAPDWFHPGRSAALRLGPTVLAVFGELHPAVLDALDAEDAGPMVAMEAWLDRVPAPKARRQGTARPGLSLSPFQPISRDFAFVVAEAVPADKVVRAARAADKTLIAEVSVFDVFRGGGLGEGVKSIALAVTLQPLEATLTDAEIEAVSARIVANVEKQTGGSLRG
jgi:phenylalanyl-tRNA synthetase beta chain